MDLRCAGCNVSCETIECRDCYLWGLQQLLESPVWSEIASTRQGDLTGETLLESFCREVGSGRAD